MRYTITQKMAALIGLGGSFLLAVPAGAQSLSITPSNAPVVAGNATFTVTQGGTFTLVVALRNTSTGTFSLNGDNANFLASTPGPTQVDAPPSPTVVGLDDGVFFNTTPRQITGSQTLTGVSLFTLAAGSGATPGTYRGYFTVQGAPAPDTVTTNDLGTLGFTVSVLAAPEPSSVAALALGALGMAGRVAVRRRRSCS